MLLPTYDYFENLRQYNQWVASTMKAFWENPVFGMYPSPVPSTLAAWGKGNRAQFIKNNIKARLGDRLSGVRRS